MSLPKILKPEHNFKLIRVGKNNDGGYLVGKKSILNSENLISLGISDDWSFEEQFVIHIWIFRRIKNSHNRFLFFS